MTRHLPISLLLCLFSGLCLSCSDGDAPDAYGIIDAHSWMIASSEAGQIVSLAVEEGMAVPKGSLACQLDTARLSLQREALQAQMEALRATLPDTRKQLDVLYRQKASLENEKARIEPLVATGTASASQLDNIADQLAVLESQITAAHSSLSRESAAILAQIESLKSQETLVRDQIRHCRIENPESGTVSEVYTKLHEFVAPGHPIYKLTDYDHPFVDAWLDINALTRIALGDSLSVTTDGPDGKRINSRGRISYIASEAEFTPNKVMTRDTRTRQVYRIRIELPASPALKPGLPAEVYLDGRL